MNGKAIKTKDDATSALSKVENTLAGLCGEIQNIKSAIENLEVKES